MNGTLTTTFATDLNEITLLTIEGSRSKAVNFKTMLELVTMFRLSEQGASTQQIVKHILI